jgi:hypothetical protein
MMTRIVRLLVPSLVLAIVPAAAAAAGTRVAAPSGSGTACTADSPCSAEQAFSGAVSGDVIELTGGNYLVTASLADFGADLTVRPRAGTGAVHIDASTPGVAMALRGTNSSVSDLSITSTAQTANPALFLGFGAQANRVRAVSAATGVAHACGFGEGTQDHPVRFIDVACINRSSDGGVGIFKSTPFGAYARLTRVTSRVLNGAAPPNYGLAAGADDNGETVTVLVEDSILEGRVADVAGGELNGATVVINLARSNFATTTSTAGTPTFGDGGGNQTAEPIWDATDPALPAPTSPTIDAGSAVGDGEFDLLGTLRFAGLATDLGAIEHVPSATVGSVTVTEVTSTSATFTAVLDTHRAAGAVGRFGYGEGQIGTGTPDQALTRVNGPQTINATVTGLSPSTTYSVAGVATGGVVTATGPVATFTTPPTQTGAPTERIPTLTEMAIAAVKRGRAGSLRLTSDTAAAATVIVERARPGRRSGSRCIANGKGRRCTRYTKVRTIRATLNAGRNRIRIPGTTTSGAKLPAGRYRLTIRATTPAGTRTATRIWTVRAR